MEDSPSKDAPRNDSAEEPVQGELRDDITEVAASTRVAHVLSGTDRGRMQVVVLLVAAGVSVFVIGQLLLPFTLGIVGAAVMAVLARPMQDFFHEKIPWPTLSALVVTALLLFLVLIPLGVFSSLLVVGVESGASVVAGQVQGLVNQRGPVWNALVSLAGLVGVEESTMSRQIQALFSNLGSMVAGGTVGFLSGLGGWVAQAGIGLVTLFYFLRDGDQFVAFLRWLIPLDAKVTDALLLKSREIVSATVFGTLVVAIVQGALGGLLFWALDLPAPALWGAVMAFFSLLPAVGPPVVWVPAALILAGSGEIGRALVLAGVGGLVIGTIDNLLRSILVGDRARLHPLLVFFAVLGGLVVYGAVGFLLGPIVIVLAISVLEIVRVIVYEELDPES
ncbi:MAG: AI-2E family transporter [Longimicrobiales bacterium]|nr:AI-2E family transporter [Longimicrobiales bacterium]